MATQIESLLWLMVALIAYFAPTWAAAKGRRTGVFVINFFLGLTVIGWIVAMYMAIRSQEATRSREGKK